MGSHSVTCHPTQVKRPDLTPARQAGTRFTYPGGIEGQVDYRQLVTYRDGFPARIQSLIQALTRLGKEQLC